MRRRTKIIAIALVAVGLLALTSGVTTEIMWDGGFPEGEYRISVRNAEGQPVKGAVLHVYRGGTRDFAFAYPLDNYVPGQDLVSDDSGRIVVIHKNGRIEFSGTSWQLFWMIRLGDKAPEYDCEIIAAGYRPYKFRIWQLVASPYKYYEDFPKTIVTVDGQEIELPIYEHNFTLEHQDLAGTGCASDLDRRVLSDWPIGMEGPSQGPNGNRVISSENVIIGKDKGMEWLSHLLEVAGKAAPLIVSIIFSGLVGYVFGAAKTFREQKLRAYEEVLPIFIKAAFEQQKADEPEFNKAIHKIWLFASKKVARKVDRAVAILVKPDRGDALRALQEVIAEMREDIQFYPWQRLKAEEVQHFYTKFGNKN